MVLVMLVQVVVKLVLLIVQLYQYKQVFAILELTLPPQDHVIVLHQLPIYHPMDNLV